MLKEANLVGKHNLRVLELIWGDDEPKSQENVEELLEALEPHSNLEKLVIENCNVTHMPRWMTDLKNKVDIDLQNCRSCFTIPPLGKLPLVQRLLIGEMAMVHCIANNLFDGCPARGFHFWKYFYCVICKV